jgi:hypothetical protein
MTRLNSNSIGLLDEKVSLRKVVPLLLRDRFKRGSSGALRSLRVIVKSDTGLVFNRRGLVAALQFQLCQGECQHRFETELETRVC